MSATLSTSPHLLYPGQDTRGDKAVSAKKRIHPHHSSRWVANWVMRFAGTSRIRAFVKAVLVIVAGVATLFLPFLKFAEYVGTNSNPIMKYIYERRISFVFVLLTVQSVGQLVLWVLSFFRRTDKAKIEQALNSLVNLHFGKTGNEDCEYRATLFKHRHLPMIGSWLGMVARSGEKYRRMGTIFSVHHSDQNQNTGVAGECFWRGKTIIHAAELIGDNDGGDEWEDRCREYKKRTFLADEEYDCLTVKSCVFFVTCIKIDGKKWGVLVVDSTDPKVAPATNQRKQLTANLEHTADLISVLLK
jgi:hypothetical protein